MSLGMNPEEVSPEQCISLVFPPLDHYLRLIGNPALAFGNELDPEAPKITVRTLRWNWFCATASCQIYLHLSSRNTRSPPLFPDNSGWNFPRISADVLRNYRIVWGLGVEQLLWLDPKTRDSLFSQGRNSATPTTQLCGRSLVFDNTRWILHFLSRKDISYYVYCPQIHLKHATLGQKGCIWEYANASRLQRTWTKKERGH
jgi:hypothetical protein